MEHHSGQITDLFQLGSHFRNEDVATLKRIAGGLDLLADVSHADLLLYVKSDYRALVVAQSQPTTVPSLYQNSLVGQAFNRDDAPTIHRALFSGHMAHGIKSQDGAGSPTVQETFPIWNQHDDLIAVVCSETNMLEFEERRRKNPVYRHAVTRLRREILRGTLEGADLMSRLGEHSAPLVIDGSGRILYASTLAEQLYRKLGYTTTLVGRRLSEFDTNEQICYKAMEQGRCLEDRIEEHNLVWIKWVIPIPREHRSGFFHKLLGRGERTGSALVQIQDITEEHRKEQELRVKSALIREIHHRVKNNLQTIAALLRMQARRTGSPEVLDMLKQSINRILSIALVHELLSKQDGSQDETVRLSIREVTQRMLSEVTQGILDPEKNVRTALEGGDFELPAQQSTSCALVINELLQNAVEHGFEVKNEGTIRVTLLDEGDQRVIEVVDNGQGLPDGFDPDKDGSLGLQIIRTLVKEDLKGQFTMSDQGGVRALITFPKQPTTA